VLGLVRRNEAAEQLHQRRIGRVVPCLGNLPAFYLTGGRAAGLVAALSAPLVRLLDTPERTRVHLAPIPLAAPSGHLR
jgi:hypothetical protein